MHRWKLDKYLGWKVFLVKNVCAVHRWKVKQRGQRGKDERSLMSNGKLAIHRVSTKYKYKYTMTHSTHKHGKLPIHGVRTKYKYTITHIINTIQLHHKCNYKHKYKYNYPYNIITNRITNTFRHTQKLQKAKQYAYKKMNTKHLQIQGMLSFDLGSSWSYWPST